VTKPKPVADVTVVIPAWRAEDTIGRALASIADQTMLPRAVVVIDDGSTDATSATAESWRDRLIGIDFSVIRQENAGAGAARNRGILAAKTAYIAFLDADDEWFPEKLERSMEVLLAGDAVLVAHDSFEIEDGAETRLECARRFDSAAAAPYAGLYRRGFIDTSTVVAKRDTVIAAGGFDVTLANGQDFELWLAMLQRPGTNFQVFGAALSKYHRIPGSIMTYIERRRVCCIAIARRYAPALKAHPGSALASLWFRILAVHLEAATAHRNTGHILAACLAVAKTPLVLIFATFGYIGQKRTPAREPLTDVPK
jgi:glycosyltransferase involved in cell wall biosynthesis